MVDNFFEKLEKKDGYYELLIGDISDFIKFIRPETLLLRKLMTKLSYLKSDIEYFDLPRIGRIEVPEPITLDKIIFRGQASSSWDLTPSFYRFKKNQNINSQSVLNLIEDEYRKLMEFQNICDLTGIPIPGDSSDRRDKQKGVIDNIQQDHISNPIDPQNFWNKNFREVGAFAQHIGIRTSFLDWSHHPFVACYFASTSAMADEVNSEDRDENISYNFLSLWVLNSDKVDSSEIMLTEPPKSINNHISHQQGLLSNINLFSYSEDTQYFKYPTLSDVLNKNDKSHHLLKIKFPLIYAPDLFEYLNMYNFNACNLFRGTSGVAKHHEDIQNQSDFLNKYDLDLTELHYT